MNLKQLRQKLKDYGIANYQQEALWFYQQSQNPETLNQWVSRRQAGEPLAYILQSAPFLDLDLYVDQRVLIPRPETEEMVLHLAKKLPTTPQTIVDVGCGSGAIALALKSLRPLDTIIGIDLSLAALDVALINQQRYHQHKVHWVQGDCLACIQQSQVDVIISNPPYVEKSWNNQSLYYEPSSAIYADDHGYAILKKIIEQVDHPVLLYLEHGYDQSLKGLLQMNAFYNIEQHVDLSGKNRFISAQKSKKPCIEVYR